MNIKYFALVVLLALSFISALLFGPKLESAILELVLLLIGIIASGFVLYGLLKETNWAWPAATILFSALLANIVYLFLSTGDFLLFAVSLIINTAGMVLTMLAVEDGFLWSTGLETYDIKTTSGHGKKRKR